MYLLICCCFLNDFLYLHYFDIINSVIFLQGFGCIITKSIMKVILIRNPSTFYRNRKRCLSALYLFLHWRHYLHHIVKLINTSVVWNGDYNLVFLAKLAVEWGHNRGDAVVCWCETKPNLWVMVPISYIIYKCILWTMTFFVSSNWSESVIPSLILEV